ncbi:glycine cleavage system aminomethyltransferase GcvT [Shimazuella sp. AN120528]|uniref:glycine cleavage system aminomethyltransferase GcvT n=1 Tax=Shimazuella soli TaxID=1892854 RepID=UPI001F0E91F8|nr:glycine cleavage system aminomethyltransferase GcvT [Shimazuella soli]MCH5584144.1 glycine cleavage system aminomethyltransferase GcvT [Shimazuella soli]
MTTLKRTPLYSVYQHQAKLVPFGGWEMPVQFSSIKDEHEAVRTRAGLFDVSHMGEVEITGEDAKKFINRVTTNNIHKLTVGQAQYTLFCYPDGGTVDDLLVYQTQENGFLLVINASNIDKDIAWLKNQIQDDQVQIVDCSEETALLALQGPFAVEILQRCTTFDLAILSPFQFARNIDICGIRTLVSRSGYTGEDGFELYVHAKDAEKLWKQLLQAGEEYQLVPCGLGARDTLRMEAALPLYGQELSAQISPLEAGLGFAVKLDKGEFIGSNALLAQKEAGVKRKKVGIEMIDRGIPRSHYSIYVKDQLVGEVTSGTQSPLTKRNIGLALIDSDFAQMDQIVEVEIRGKRVKAKIVPTPFYRRARG